MLKKSLLSLSLASIALFSAPACKKAEDLSKLKGTVMSLANTYAPKLQEIVKQIGPLKDRIGKLPDSIPAVGEIKGLLTQHEGSLAKVQGLLSGLNGQVTAAKSAGDLTKLQESVNTEATAGIAALTKGLGELTTKVEVVEKEVAASAAANTAAVAEYMKKLSSGFELKGAMTGIESQLVAFIEDAAKPVDKTTWFNFDRLTFTTGSADIDMDKSKDQLNNMNEIMKAFPNVKLKVGGYTDGTGDAAKNKEISQKRAEAVSKALAGMGVDATRLEAEGYGPEHPVCDEKAAKPEELEACQAQNRRIAVRVTAK